MSQNAADRLRTTDMDKEDVEEEIEHHKQDQLKKKMDGKNHWTDELASESESIVWLVFSISARLRRAFFSISKPLGSLSANPSQYNHSLVSFLYHKVSDSKHRLRTQGVAARLTPRSRPVQVKADRTEAKSTADEIDRLQKHTTEKLSSKSKRETTDK